MLFFLKAKQEKTVEKLHFFVYFYQIPNWVTATNLYKLFKKRVLVWKWMLKKVEIHRLINIFNRF